MKKFKNILLVNDDGYESEAIKLTKVLLLNYAERVVIASPFNKMSGKSSAITIGKEIEFKEVGEDYYYVKGTPVDCVFFGLYCLNIDFDLVVSGVNEGENLTYDSIYSGTIGAALEALRQNKNAIAFSCPLNFDLFKKEFNRIMDYIIDNDLLSFKYLLNVNLPLGDEVKGIKVVRLSNREDKHYSKVGDNTFLIEREINYNFEAKDDDWYCFNNSIVSIAPLSANLFKDIYYSELIKKTKNSI